MVMANTERVAKALGLLRDGLGPACEDTWRGFYGDGWLQRVNSRLHSPEPDPSTGDVAFLFKGMKATWNEVFGHGFPAAVRSLVFEVSDVRNRWAHQRQLSTDDTVRALDSMERVLEAFGNSAERDQIRSLRRDLMRQMFDEESRSERRRTAAKPTEGTPESGLTPWRDIITPHADVAAGRFEQAEYAADLDLVAAGGAEPEYQDPQEFFTRTYITQGLHDLLAGAARRLSGGGGDPVIELQTNFGGGKTHSMIALYHLASGTDPNKLPGVADVLAAEGIELPANVNRAVLVGQMISVSAPLRVPGGIRLHTLWGRLAYQLGGKDGYDIVRADDLAGTSPGAALKTLFERFGPAVVLIDEWVAYARQLRDGSSGQRGRAQRRGRLRHPVHLRPGPHRGRRRGARRGGADLHPRLRRGGGRPAGQDRAREAQERRGPQGGPVAAGIARRVLRDRAPAAVRPHPRRSGPGARRGDPGVLRHVPHPGRPVPARRRRGRVPPPHGAVLPDPPRAVRPALRRLVRPRQVPAHPGCAAAHGLAISQLWQRDDRSLLIMPGNLPMDYGLLVSEMKKYLEDGWDPVIKSDVDGANSLPLRIDRDNSHFGRLSAARRAARTVYMGSAPRPDGRRGVDEKSIVLGCTQPGESPRQFADALKRLSGEATHLYVDGRQYWYSLIPNVTRLAADRANSNYKDIDADDEVRRRIDAQRDRGSFAAVQVFAEGPGDVPDNDDGVRLVVLEPDATHSPNDANSPAVALAGKILAQRDAGPRLNRNLVVFVAAAANRLAELRAAARLYLAWKSIVADQESMNLTPHQLRQAESKLQETSKQVDSLIGETFTLTLTPSQSPGTSEIDWQTTRATAAGDLASRVSQKLVSEEKLIATYSGVRIRMDLDRRGLWTDRGDTAVHKLWETYARFPHMPRLASRDVLYNAIANRASTITWQRGHLRLRRGPRRRPLGGPAHRRRSPPGPQRPADPPRPGSHARTRASSAARRRFPPGPGDGPVGPPTGDPPDRRRSPVSPPSSTPSSASTRSAASSNSPTSPRT